MRARGAGAERAVRSPEGLSGLGGITMELRGVSNLYRRFERIIVSAGLLTLFLIGHRALNELAHLRPARYLPELIERHIPFLPSFIAVYLLSFALVFVPAFVIRDRHSFRRTARTFLVVLLISFALFLVCPLTVQRVESPQGDGIFVGMLRWFQSVAKPHNTFPSLHVALCAVAAVSSLAHSRPVGIGMAVYSVLVVVSTLVLKLHNALDVVAGLLLALVVWMWVGRAPRREHPRTV